MLSSADCSTNRRRCISTGVTARKPSKRRAEVEAHTLRPRERRRELPMRRRVRLARRRDVWEGRAPSQPWALARLSRAKHVSLTASVQVTRWRARMRTLSSGWRLRLKVRLKRMRFDASRGRSLAAFIHDLGCAQSEVNGNSTERCSLGARDILHGISGSTTSAALPCCPAIMHTAVLLQCGTGEPSPAAAMAHACAPRQWLRSSDERICSICVWSGEPIAGSCSALHCIRQASARCDGTCMLRCALQRGSRGRCMTHARCVSYAVCQVCVARCEATCGRHNKGEAQHAVTPREHCSLCEGVLH